MPPIRCLKCNRNSSPLYRCRDCHNSRLLCRRCCRKTHRYHPFHRLQQWTGEHFRNASLDDVGIVIFLGHDGDPCPNINWKAKSSPIRFFFGDVAGFFARSVRKCECQKPKNELWRQLVRSGFIPASWQFPRTAFSTRLLDFLHTMQMECHTALRNIYDMFLRFTDEDGMLNINDRYVELLRTQRCYRDLQWRIQGGAYHDPGLLDSPGSMALFCSNCPQPGVNVFEFEPNDPRWMRRLNLAMDGCFKMEGLRMRNPDKDVPVRDGLGFMVQTEQFNRHIKLTDAFRPEPRGTCRSQNRVDHPVNNLRHLQYRGIGCIACARHGCFFPNACMNIHNGEQYRIFDLGVSNVLEAVEALNQSNVPEDVKIDTLAMIYDIMCNYSVNLLPRLKQSLLKQPEEIRVKLLTMVGKWHLGGHQEKCWSLYTLELLLGAGRIDGEILESLWSLLNRSKRSVRALSHAHRQELLDDLMQDSNFKKLLGGDELLLKRLEKALAAEKDARQHFLDLRSRAKAEELKEWDAIAKRAHELREPEMLKMYESEKMEAKTFLTVKAELAQAELTLRGREGGDTKFLCDGLSIEVAQRKLKLELKRLPTELGPRQRSDLTDQRWKLLRRCRKFHELALSKMGLESSDQKDWPILLPLNQHHSDPVAHAEPPYIDYDEYDPALPDPETMVLPLPSNLSPTDRNKVGWKKLSEKEASLRQGIIQDTLTELRLAMGQRLMRFRDLRDEASQTERQATQSGLNRLKRQIRDLRDRYMDQVEALIRLSGDNGITAQYPEITDEDLYLSHTHGKPEVRKNKKATKLAWFWTGSDVSIDVEIHEMPIMAKFYKVNYLRAHASWQRWHEEVLLLRKEMEWRINWFAHLSNVWKARADNVIFNAGARSYALAQAARWERFRTKSQRSFRTYTDSFSTPHK